MRVAAHQPNFLPWIGFFAKAAQSDVLVLLDDVAYSGGSYSNRVRIKGGKWLTVPLSHPNSGHSIRWLRVSEQGGWGSVLRKLRDAYPRLHGVGEIERRAEDHMPWFEPAAADMIAIVLRALNVKTKIVRATDLRTWPERGSAGLVQLCKALGGTTYVAGNGSAKYEDLGLYAAAGIKHEKFAFTHPVYEQAGEAEFRPGLSVVDMIGNVGIVEARKMLRKSIS